VWPVTALPTTHARRTARWLVLLFFAAFCVGNIVNVLGMVRECRFPLVTLVTMRGEQGEFNPWQVPMGQAVRPVLEAMDTVVQYADKAEEVAPIVNAALRLAYNSYASVAVLISQRLIGIKSFQEQAAQ